MTWTTLLVFIPACFALNMIPGSNNMLSVHNAVHYGFSSSFVGGIGRLFAFVIMIFLASAGLATIITTSKILFLFIKVLGALYLIYLAIQLWRIEPEEQVIHGEKSLVKKPSKLSLMRHEFIVAGGNPKAILIFTAFLPQFVSSSEPVGEQFLILGVVFIILEIVAISIYAFLGSNLQKLLSTRTAKKMFNRICSGMLGIAGFALLLSKKNA
ncbi:LysE family translocator [Acinetobacter bereziniae]|jgi:threonine/homoserine/homoserine lactone efflux protein|uniref:LysE family translocator n=1 Tax=Acinetobacter TaxID=469 RepID=UPI002076343B|nr:MULTISPECIES: LysE family translocator [Acinetobacter]MCM8510734.1 LysE family translocator [Acinetobacter bereziniae]MDR3028096.1 LysE family translocator [Acinetobacter sp.]